MSVLLMGCVSVLLMEEKRPTGEEGLSHCMCAFVCLKSELRPASREGQEGGLAQSWVVLVHLSPSVTGAEKVPGLLPRARPYLEQLQAAESCLALLSLLPEFRSSPALVSLES